MTKQHLENNFREQLNTLNDILWYQKFFHVRGLYVPVPADFIILANDRYLVECKECKNDAFAFSRLTQLAELKRFELKHKQNHSYVLVSFWKGNKNKSEYFIIPIDKFVWFMDIIPKKSANITDFNTYLTEYSIDMVNIKSYFI